MNEISTFKNNFTVLKFNVTEIENYPKYVKIKNYVT